MLLGLWIAGTITSAAGSAEAFVRMFPAVHRFVLNKWYFDEIYDVLFVRPSLWLGRCSGRAVTKARSTASAARRGLCGRGRQQGHDPAAVGLSLFLCAGDAARPDRRGELGDLVGRE
jgi:NADH:ubiquinone oxidoreductase subunit 5 (subunit L)/multisubunit Na+/H+ antiporter MnhA subunit